MCWARSCATYGEVFLPQARSGTRFPTCKSMARPTRARLQRSAGGAHPGGVLACYCSEPTGGVSATCALTSSAPNAFPSDSAVGLLLCSHVAACVVGTPRPWPWRVISRSDLSADRLGETRQKYSWETECPLAQTWGDPHAWWLVASCLIGNYLRATNLPTAGDEVELHSVTFHDMPVVSELADIVVRRTTS